MRYRLELAKDHFLAAAAPICNFQVKPSGPKLVAQLEALYTDLRACRAGGDEANRKAIRDLLRNGRYRPSGRSKPAQEYLAKVFAERGEIDLINNAVDINNLVSLKYGLPLSAFDATALDGDVTIRLGRPGERYVFNSSGQELDCQDLVVVCDERGPIGSPVKDSEATKLFPGADTVLYVIYASEITFSPSALVDVAEELGRLVSLDCPEAVADTPRLFDEMA